MTDNEGNRSITKKKRRATFNTGTRPTLDESFISWTKIMPLFCCMFTKPVVLLYEALIKSLTNYLSYIVTMVTDAEWKLMERDRQEVEPGPVMETYEYCLCSTIE